MEGVYEGREWDEKKKWKGCMRVGIGMRRRSGGVKERLVREKVEEWGRKRGGAVGGAGRKGSIVSLLYVSRWRSGEFEPSTRQGGTREPMV